MVQPAQHIYRRFGPRRMMIAGMIGAAITTFAFMAVGLETNQWWIRLIMLGRGWSFALTLVPLQAATFATIRPQDTGRASAVFNSGRQVAASFGVALIATVLTNRMTHHGAQLGNPVVRDGAVLAFHDAFFVAGVLAIVGVFASFLIRDRDAISTMSVGQAESPAERVAAGAH
jgi:MFS family permease